MSVIDDIANACGMSSEEQAEFHAVGNVIGVNDDGSLEVALNTSEVTTKCARYCDAAIGDRVIVLIKGGLKAAIAKRR